MPKILISACLLGQKVRFDGHGKQQYHARLQTWIDNGQVITICPEMAGGLPTPRAPAEIEPNKTAQQVLAHEAKVLTIDHQDVTHEFISGAEKALLLAQQHQIKVAILKARSPSCGSTQIYNGQHAKILVDGMGVTAALLTQHGIQVFDETQIDAALDVAEKISP